MSTRVGGRQRQLKGDRSSALYDVLREYVELLYESGVLWKYCRDPATRPKLIGTFTPSEPNSCWNVAYRLFFACFYLWRIENGRPLLAGLRSRAEERAEDLRQELAEGTLPSLAALVKYPGLGFQHLSKSGSGIKEKRIYELSEYVSQQIKPYSGRECDLIEKLRVVVRPVEFAQQDQRAHDSRGSRAIDRPPFDGPQVAELPPKSTRLQQQLAKTLKKILSDPQLTKHRFFEYWSERHPGVTVARLCEYCIDHDKPYSLLVEIAEAVNATWTDTVTAHDQAAAQGVRLIDLCYQMSLVACERWIHLDPAGKPTLDNGVLNVGMFAREAAAIVAAVWIGCAAKLELRAASNGHRLHVTNSIYEYAEPQIGNKTLEDVIDDEVSFYGHRQLYPRASAPCALRPEIVRSKLDSMERNEGLRLLIGIDGQLGHLQFDEALRQRLAKKWGVGFFFYHKRRDELPEEVSEQWRLLGDSMLEHFTEILKTGGIMTDAPERKPLVSSPISDSTEQKNAV